MDAYCPRCNLPADEMDTCVNKSFGPAFQCPEPVEADPETTIHVSCGPCGKRLFLPIGQVMRGESRNRASGCSSDVCAAKVMLARVPTPQVPPPLTPEPLAASRPSGPPPAPKAKAPTPTAKGSK